MSYDIDKRQKDTLFHIGCATPMIIPCRIVGGASLSHMRGPVRQSNVFYGAAGCSVARLLIRKLVLCLFVEYTLVLC